MDVTTRSSRPPRSMNRLTDLVKLSALARTTIRDFDEQRLFFGPTCQPRNEPRDTSRTTEGEVMTDGGTAAPFGDIVVIASRQDDFEAPIVSTDPLRP